MLICVDEEGRRKLAANDPRFWCLYSTKPESEQQKAADALSAWWDEKKSELPDNLVGKNLGIINECVESFYQVADKYRYDGAEDTEGREGVLILLSKHYDIPYETIYKLWLGAAPKTPVNSPFEGRRE